MGNKSLKLWFAVIFSSLLLVGLFLGQVANGFISKAIQNNQSNNFKNGTLNFDSKTSSNVNSSQQVKDDKFQHYVPKSGNLVRSVTSQDKFIFNTFDDINLTCNLVSYNGTDSKVVIPDFCLKDGKEYKVITSLSPFKKNNTIQSITTGKYLQSIGQDFASSCPNLSEVNLNEGITIINGWAFQNNPKLVNFTFPSSVQSIENGAFQNCNNLKTIDFGSNSQLTNIGDSAFIYDSNLQGNIVIPKNVTTIGDLAFFGCFQNAVTNLSFEIGSQLKYIKDKSFAYTSYLQGETIFPATLTTIGDEAFLGSFAKAPSKITFPNNSQLTYLGVNSFSNATCLEGELLVPKGIKNISQSAFSNAYSSAGPGSLKFALDSQLQKISVGAFSQTTNLSGNVTFPASLTSIEESAFENSFSKQTSSINFPIDSQLKTIGKSAFQNAIQLSGQLIIPKEVTEISQSAFSNAYSGDNSGNLVFASDSKLTTIGPFAFMKTKKMSGDLNLPEGLTSIGIQAFDTSGFTQLSLPSTLAAIPEYCFEFSMIKETLIPGNIKTIGKGAFYRSNLVNLKISDGVETIDTLAFAFIRVKKLVVPISVKNIYYQAFWSGRLEQLELPSTTALGSPTQQNDAFSWNNIWSIKITNPKDGPIGAGNQSFNGQSIYKHFNYTKDITIDNLFDLNIDHTDQAKKLQFSNITNGVTFSNNTFHIPSNINRFTFNFEGIITSEGQEDKAYNGVYTVDFSSNRIRLRNVIVTQGSIWNPESNFVGAEDDEGNDIPFSKITVNPNSIDTSQIGNHTVTYTYEDVSATANVFVTQRTSDTSAIKVRFYAIDDYGKITDLPGAPTVPDITGFINLNWSYTAPDEIGEYEIVGSKNTQGTFQLGENTQNGTFELTTVNPEISFYYALKKQDFFNEVPDKLNFGTMQYSRQNIYENSLINGPKYLRFHIGSSSKKSELAAQMSPFKPNGHDGSDINGTIKIQANQSMIDADGYVGDSPKPIFASNTLQINSRNQGATVLFNNLSNANKGNWKVILTGENTNLKLYQLGSAGDYAAKLTWTITESIP